MEKVSNELNIKVGERQEFSDTMFTSKRKDFHDGEGNGKKSRPGNQRHV